MITSDSDRTDSRPTSHTAARGATAGQQIGEGKADDDAAKRHQDGQHQREAEHAAEEGR